MKYSYYPGCTLSAKAQELDRWGRRAMEALGVTLEELPQWQCCGAVYPNATDEIATRLSSVRALSAAKEAGQPLVTLCSACHHVIRRVNGDMRNNIDIRQKVRELEIQQQEGYLLLSLKVDTGSQSNLNPEVLLEKLRERAELSGGDMETMIERVEMYAESAEGTEIPLYFLK